MHHFEKLKPAAQFVLRVSLAIIFIYHGYPKLFAHRIQSYAEFSKMGFPWYFALAIGILEFFGGCLLLVGVYTRFVALLFTAEMIIALWRVHMSHGLFAIGNYQFPLLVAVAAFTLLTIGPGPASADRLILKSKS